MTTSPPPAAATPQGAAEGPASSERRAKSGPDPDVAGGRLFVLDGWRAISILLVLATHLLPVGPKAWQLNLATGAMGMSLFFTLSGFLITQQLHLRRNIPGFFVRRLFRIVPLAWAYTVVVVLLLRKDLHTLVSHFLFVINYDQNAITDVTTHFWSLCVEVHFYCAIGLLMWITRFRGFVALPVLWLILFLVRTIWAPTGTIETHFRVDEIFSGACLALVYLGYLGPRVQLVVARLPLPLLLIALAIACHPNTGTVNGFRGLLASLVVGHTLFATGANRYRLLGHRVLRYIAEISYALYVIHPLTRYGWLGSGPTMVKYAKRLITFTLTFGLAHLSTFKFEKPCTTFGKRLAARLERRTT